MKPVSMTDLQADWWRRWWKADYSWNGLAKHKVAGWYIDGQGRFTRERQTGSRNRLATLQDLWAGEEHHTIKGPDGRDWTLIHVPLQWRDGTAAKSSFDTTELNDIEAAIERACQHFPHDQEAKAPTSSGPGKGLRLTTYGASPGLPMDGAVLNVLPEAWVSMRFLKADSAMLGDGGLPRKPLKNLHLRDALINDDLDLREVEDGGEFRILNGIVAGETTLSSIKARRVQIFGLRGAQGLSMDDVECEGALSLRNNRFRDAVSITEIKCSNLDLSKTRITDDLIIDGLAGSLNISEAKVDGLFSLSETTCEELYATELDVGGQGTIDTVKVTKQAELTNSRWSQALRMSETTLSDPRFAGATFEGPVDFSGTRFEGPVTFARAHFKSTADFRRTVWQSALDDHAGAFKETRFDSFVDFRNTDFEAFSAFDGAMFKAEIRFDRDRVLSDAHMDKVLKSAGSADALLDLEHGFRSLKQAAEGVRDRHLEQAFFRYELLARRRQASTPRTERVLSWWYGFVSNYGASFGRPISAALALWVVFTAAYLGLALTSGSPDMPALALPPGAPHPAWPEAFGLSTRSMFNLFGVWNLRPPPETQIFSLEQILLGSKPSLAVWTRAISTFQSILAGVLLFLIALAARRRFQIS